MVVWRTWCIWYDNLWVRGYLVLVLAATGGVCRSPPRIVVLFLKRHRSYVDCDCCDGQQAEPVDLEYARHLLPTRDQL